MLSWFTIFSVCSLSLRCSLEQKNLIPSWNIKKKSSHLFRGSVTKCSDFVINRDRQFERGDAMPQTCLRAIFFNNQKIFNCVMWEFSEVGSEKGNARKRMKTSWSCVAIINKIAIIIHLYCPTLPAAPHNFKFTMS